MKKFWIFSTLILWMLLGAVMLYYVNKPVANTSKLKPDFSVAGTELYKAFETDEESANQKYLGKVLEVSGTVKDVGKDETGHSTIMLAVNDDMFGISCKLNESLASSDLHKGDEVVVKGVCSGKLMDVILVNCNLETM